MNNIKTFSALNREDIDMAGGKGANLGELVRAGLPVPAGYIITTAAYNSYVQTHGLQAQINELVKAVSLSDPKTSQIASEQIRALFQQGTIADELANEITVAYSQLVENGSDAVAVRSSATAEDLPTASFAGQQDTYLNVQGETALLSAVKNCWASLWTARAIAYRLRQGIEPSVVSLAVVVQQLIPADSAGILFTANPTTGERDEILINATWGLGEAIVGGLVTPDIVVVAKSSNEIISRETTSKMVMTMRTESGTDEVGVPAGQQNAPVLTDQQALQLARYSTQIETHYGIPMDIEWAIADGKIAILQARPITSLPPAPFKNVVWEPAAPNTIWMRRQIVEHMPQPLSPLFEDLYLDKGLGTAIDEIAGMLGEVGNVQFSMDIMIPWGFATTINGYAYTTGSFKASPEAVLSILKIYARIYRFFNLTAFDFEETVLPKYQSIIARWQAVEVSRASDETLLQGMREMAAADPSFWFGSALNLGLSRFMDTFFDGFLKSFLVRGALPTPRPGSSSFLRGFDSKALDAQADMEAMADLIRASDSLRELVDQTPADQLITALADHADGQTVLDGMQRYLAEYGHQIYNLDFVDPTQNEDPLPMLLSLKALVKTPPAQDVRTRQAQMAAEREALVAQVEGALNPVSRGLFRLIWQWTKYYGPYREHVMFYMGGAWPTLRKLAHELGQRLTDAGVIAQPDRIYYLTSEEITTAISAKANGQAVPDFAEMTRERFELREGRKRLTPLPKVPAGSSLKFGPLDLSMFDPTPTDMTENTGAVLNGYAVSPGRVTAPASVIHSIEDFDQMQPNSILVCTTTTPAWTPLFSQAVGLVTDVGGALAHGSIVAREYGIPAVMGIGVATDRIKSGMMLAIDGDSGTVTLLDEVDETKSASHLDSTETEERAKTRKIAALVTVVAFIAGWLWWRRRK